MSFCITCTYKCTYCPPDSSSWPLKAIYKHLRHNKLTEKQAYIPLIKEFVTSIDLRNPTWKYMFNWFMIRRNNWHIKLVTTVDIKKVTHGNEKQFQWEVCDHAAFQNLTWKALLYWFMRGRNHINVKFGICYLFDRVVIKKMTNMLLVHEKKKHSNAKFVTYIVFQKLIWKDMLNWFMRGRNKTAVIIKMVLWTNMNKHVHEKKKKTFKCEILGFSGSTNS